MRSLTGAQIRAARGLLNLSQSALAELSDLTQAALSAIERDAVSAQAANLDRIAAVLEDRGVVFIAGTEKTLPARGPGVQLKDAPALRVRPGRRKRKAREAP